jgi:hypothetical protein
MRDPIATRMDAQAVTLTPPKINIETVVGMKTEFDWKLMVLPMEANDTVEIKFQTAQKVCEPKPEEASKK